MSGTKTESSLTLWSVPESPLHIEYSAQVLDDIRIFVIKGLQQLSRGGVEVGGVLFGTRGENVVRVLTWRPIQCEHAEGAGFVLSQEDRVALGRQLQNAKSDPELADLHPVGWFVSHMRIGVALTEADLKTYNDFFPWSWQIALVLRPSMDGGAQAGFFLRDVEGKVKAGSSYREFALQPLSPEPPISSAPPARRPQAPHPPPNTADRRMWIWAVPAVLAAIIGVMFFRHPMPPSTPTISFRVIDAGGELRLEWDKNAQAVRDSVRGTLDIKDGANQIEVPLSTERLRQGAFDYDPRSGDLEIRMTVYPLHAAAVQESARFVGAPGALPVTDNIAKLRRERDSLANQIERLREELRKSNSRNHELQEALRILERRVQIDRYHRPSTPDNK